MRADAALADFREQAVDRLGPQSRTGTGGRVEKDELELVAPTLAAQQRIDDEQILEHWPAPHRALFVGVGGEPDGNSPALHLL